MNPEQLQGNYYNAVVAWLERNGGFGDKSPSHYFDLKKEAKGIVISRWAHETKRPLDGDLMALTVEEVTWCAERRQIVQDMAAQALRRLTTAKRDALGAVPIGTLIYNTTSNRVQIYSGARWDSLAQEA